MTRPLKVLISGTGFAGQGHADTFRNVGAEIVGMVGRTPSVLDSVASKKAIPYTNTDWEEALADCQPDIVSIGTPGGAHYKTIIPAIQQGCHVYCDKPLSDTGASPLIAMIFSPITEVTIEILCVKLLFNLPPPSSFL